LYELNSQHTHRARGLLERKTAAVSHVKELVDEFLPQKG
jgi:hypothetical protein